MPKIWKHLDKPEHYDQMRDTLAKIAAGDIPSHLTVMQFAANGLSGDRRNANGVTFNEFMAVIYAADHKDSDKEDIWLTHWNDDETPEEAMAEVKFLLED